MSITHPLRIGAETLPRTPIQLGTQVDYRLRQLPHVSSDDGRIQGKGLAPVFCGLIIR